MTDITEKLWPAFHAEASEQLEALELALLDHGATDADVHALFRYFHTLKGGCAMMGYAPMQALAHAGEDLLAPVRRGERQLDTACVEVLLATVDGLQQQLQSVATTRQPPQPRPDLLERLQRLTVATTPPASPVIASAAMPVSGPTSAAIEVFAGLSRQQLPTWIAAALQGDQPGTGWMTAGHRLAQAATDAAMDAPAQLLSMAMLCDSQVTRQACLADLLDRLGHLQTLSGCDCGVEAAARQLRPSLGPGFRAVLEQLNRAMTALAAGDTSAMHKQAGSALEHTETGLTLALLLQMPHTVQLLRCCAQLLRELARRSLAPDPMLAELLLVAAGLPAELADLEEDAAYGVLCAQLQDRLWQAAVGATDLAALQADVRRQLVPAPADLDSLQPRELQNLLDALDQQAAIVEIDADLEAMTGSGAGFVDWLSSRATLISNHSVFQTQGQTTRLRFLAAFALPLETIRQELAGQDPEGRHCTLRHCAYQEPETAAAAAPIAATETGTTAPSSPAVTGSTLRIDSAALDRFVNRVGEMVMLRNRLAHVLHQDDIALRLAQARRLLRAADPCQPLAAEERAGLEQLLADLVDCHEQLGQADLRLQGALGRMQEEVLALRVLPIGLVFNRLSRVVHDISYSLGKQVRLQLAGDSVRIDKRLVDSLAEPLLHLVRNAIDHGVETPDERSALGKSAQATLTVAARQQGGMLVVEVGDDGRGLDLERIRRQAMAQGLASEQELATWSEQELSQLIFLPGFSTARAVTEVSGRGVGMDVVRTRIGQLGGQVDVTSQPGLGTRFTLRLPLSVAIQNVILVAAGAWQLALPERHVAEIVSLPATALQTVQGQACCLLRGATLPLYQLTTLLGNADTERPARNTLEVVVMTDGIHRIGVLVDRVIGRPEVFVRDLHPDLARLPGVGGATLLGDGRVVIIVDCDKLFELAQRQAQSLHSLLSTV